MLMEFVATAIEKVMGKKQAIHPDTLFIELGMDSTHVVELLIELEIILDIDVLDNRLNLDEMIRVGDLHQYVAHLTAGQTVELKNRSTNLRSEE